MTALVSSIAFLVRLLVGLVAIGAFAVAFDDENDSDAILHRRVRGVAVGLAAWFVLWVTW